MLKVEPPRFPSQTEAGTGTGHRGLLFRGLSSPPPSSASSSRRSKLAARELKMVWIALDSLATDRRIAQVRANLDASLLDPHDGGRRPDGVAADPGKLGDDDDAE